MVAHSQSYYELLGVPPTATPQEIKTAYRNLARQYHPDVRETDEDVRADELLKKINVAYEVLSDPLKRARYDRQERDRWRVPAAGGVTYAAANPLHRQVHHQTPFKLLFFAIGFVLVMSIVMTIVLVAFTPVPEPPKTVGQFYAEQTQTVTARRIAAINRLPTSTPPRETLRRAWTPDHTEGHNYALAVVECQLVPSEQRLDCPSPLITVSGGDVGGQTSLMILLSGYTRVQFEMQLSDGPVPYLVIRDGLDDEASMVSLSAWDTLSILGNRLAEPRKVSLVPLERTLQAGDTLLIEVADQRVAWWLGDRGEEILSRDLIVLRSGSGPARSDLYATFGRGVASVTIRLYSPVLLNRTATPTPAGP